MNLRREMACPLVHVAQAAEAAISQVANLRRAPRWHPGAPPRLAVSETAGSAACATSRAGFTAAPREFVRGVLTLTLLSILLLAPPGLAQESRPASRPARQAPASRPSPANLFLRVLDANHDGVIEAEEIADASDALDKLDKDGDGRLTQIEYDPVAAAAARRRAAASASRPAPAAVRIPRGGLENFGVVDDHLLRGAQPSAEGIRTLKTLGVTTIIDLTVPDKVAEAEKAEVEKNGMDYINIPIDSLAPPTPDQAQAILATISNAPGKVFVHCRQGKDRTGTIVACYRIDKCQWTNKEALGEADRFRMVGEALQMREFITGFGRSEPAASNPGGSR